MGGELQIAGADKDMLGYSEDHPAVVASLHALSLGKKSWEAGRDECLAWAKVRAEFGDGRLSNTGHKGVYWAAPRKGRKAEYVVSYRSKRCHMAAPPTLEEARRGDLLDAAVAKRAELREQIGGKEHRLGVTAQFVAVLSASEVGRSYLASVRNNNAVRRLDRKASAGDAYGDDGWSCLTAIDTHIRLCFQPDCRELVVAGISGEDALALVSRRSDEKRRSTLRLVVPKRAPRRRYVVVDKLPASTSKGLLVAMKAGVTLDEIVHAWGTLLDARATGDERAA